VLLLEALLCDVELDDIDGALCDLEVEALL
jgi:hypothetical protein